MLSDVKMLVCLVVKLNCFDTDTEWLQSVASHGSVAVCAWTWKIVFRLSHYTSHDELVHFLLQKSLFSELRVALRSHFTLEYTC